MTEYDIYLDICRQRGLRPVSQRMFVSFRMVARANWHIPVDFHEYQGYVRNCIEKKVPVLDWEGYKALCETPLRIPEYDPEWTDISDAIAREVLLRAMERANKQLDRNDVPTDWIFVRKEGKFKKLIKRVFKLWKKRRTM